MLLSSCMESCIKQPWPKQYWQAQLHNAFGEHHERNMLLEEPISQLRCAAQADMHACGHVAPSQQARLQVLLHTIKNDSKTGNKR